MYFHSAVKQSPEWVKSVIKSSSFLTDTSSLKMRRFPFCRCNPGGTREIEVDDCCPLRQELSKVGIDFKLGGQSNWILMQFSKQFRLRLTFRLPSVDYRTTIGHLLRCIRLNLTQRIKVLRLHSSWRFSRHNLFNVYCAKLPIVEKPNKRNHHPLNTFLPSEPLDVTAAFTNNSFNQDIRSRTVWSL